MCDFHNFGLIFTGQMHCLPQRLKSTLFEIFSNGGCPKGTQSLIFMILVSLENVKKYSHVVARLPQRLKSTLFEIFFYTLGTLWVPFGHPPFEKTSNNVDFGL